MADGDKTSQQLQAELFLQLSKEQTAAMLELTKAVRALGLQIIGIAPTPEEPDGRDGLMDHLGGVEEALGELDSHLVGTNVMLARVNYVFDRLVEIASGDESTEELADGKEPEPGKTYKQGRIPAFRDLSVILVDYDKELEEEAKKQIEAEIAAQEAPAEADAPAAPVKPSMLTNAGPRLRALPPLPVAAPMPGPKM
ncbi:MAG: hypothetical protein ACRDZ4_06980 [Egibacteraceae bacterium]